MPPHPTPSPAKLACLEKKATPQTLRKSCDLPPSGYIRQSQLIPQVIPISPATLWRWVKTGQFVAPVKLGGPGSNVTAWKCEDVRRWMDSKESK